MVVAPAYDGTHAFFAIDGDRLVAYELVTGAQMWMVTAQPIMQPAAGGGLLYLLEAGILRALRVADGSLVWQIPFSETLAVPPVWDNGWLIVASTAGEIGALRAADGQLIWRRDIKSPAHARPALAADRVYIPTSDHRIVALRVETGEPVWERRLGGAPNDILALSTRLYVGSEDNFFYCVMGADGRVDWRWRTGGDVIGVPIADERHVYFVGLDNVLRALNLVSGGQQWMRPLPARPAWGPVRAGSTIVVTGRSATLLAFDVKDGAAVGTLTGVLVPSTTVAPEPELDPDAAVPGDTPALVDAGRLGGAARSAVSTSADLAESAEDGAPKAPFSFGTLDTLAEAAGPPYVFEHPSRGLPAVLLVFKDIAKGASATLVMKGLEPALVAAVAALPNLVQVAPVTPTTPPQH